MIVPDASVIVELLLATPIAARVQQRLFGDEDSLHAPALLDIEVAQVIRRFASRGEITAARGQSALELLSRFPMTRHPHEPLLPRIWSLRHNLTAYDAAYVALAEGLRATLVTRDRRLAGAAGILAAVEVL